MAQDLLVTGHHYHVFTRSIAQFVVFRNEAEFLRMREAFRYYQHVTLLDRFSRVFSSTERRVVSHAPSQIPGEEILVQIIAYCLMPTHLHLFLRQEVNQGISIFMARILNSYTRYFNVKTQRKGPLWESRFQRVRVDTDEQALHLTRYLHLNPSSAGLVLAPSAWKFSSYEEYVGELVSDERLCEYRHLNFPESSQYRLFVENYREEQRERAFAKVKPMYTS